MAPKRPAAEAAAAAKSQPSQSSKAPGGKKPPSGGGKAVEPKPPRLEAELDYPEPDEFLFDAEIDLAATIAANAAALHGNSALERLLQDWRAFSEKELDAHGRLAVRVVAAFVEGERAVGSDAALTGGEGGAGPSEAGGMRVTGERMYLRCKSIGDLMGGQQGRGHDCLSDPPGSTGDVKVALRTLSVEDATLYILDAYAQQQFSAALQGQSSGPGAGGSPVDGEEAGGALPSNWTDQLAQWESEGVEERARFERMAATIGRCLRGLTVFVMRNGGHYVATSHLKYVLGLEKKPYELFRVLREHNRASGQPIEAGEEDVDWNTFNEMLNGKVFTAGPGVPRLIDCGETMDEWHERRAGTEAHDDRPLRSTEFAPGRAMVQALAGLASSPEGLADAVITSAACRGADPVHAADRAQEQLAAVSDGVAADRFRTRAIEVLGKQLTKEMERGPPEEAFEEMGRRLAAATERKRDAPVPSDGPAGVAWGVKKPRGTPEEKPKRIVPEPVLKTLEDVEKFAREPLDEWKDDAGGEYVDGPDSEEEGDECTVGVDWEQWYYDRDGFEPNAPVPIRELGEISRFWCEFGVPDQVVVMQHNYDAEAERKYQGRHNLWTFKVLSNIMPMSRFLKSAPSSETFVAADLAREAFGELAPETGFDRSIAIAALAHSMGVPTNGENVHATGIHLLGLARANAARARAAGAGKETAEGSARAASSKGGEAAPRGAGGTASPPTLLEAHEHSLLVHGRKAAASIAGAAVAVEKERWESGTSDWGKKE